MITPPNLSANAGTFTATGLTENTSYTFTVQALGPEAWFRPSAQIKYGAWSGSATVTITTPVAPPTGLTAVSTVAGTAALNWVDNSAVETAYDVERSTDGNSWTVLSSTLPIGTATYTDSSAAIRHGLLPREGNRLGGFVGVCPNTNGVGRSDDHHQRNSHWQDHKSFGCGPCRIWLWRG